jgi:hypothetical protein
LRVVVPEKDVFIGRIDVGDVRLLKDLLRFPIEGDERDNFEVVADEWSGAWGTEEDVITGVMLIESKLDSNAGLGNVMEVHVQL